MRSPQRRAGRSGSPCPLHREAQRGGFILQKGQLGAAVGIAVVAASAAGLVHGDAVGVDGRLAEHQAGEPGGRRQGGALGLHIGEQLVVDLQVDLALDLIGGGTGAVEDAGQLHGKGELAPGVLLVPEGLGELAHGPGAVGGKADVEGEGAVQLDLAGLVQLVGQAGNVL